MVARDREIELNLLSKPQAVLRYGALSESYNSSGRFLQLQCCRRVQKVMVFHGLPSPPKNVIVPGNRKFSKADKAFVQNQVQKRVFFVSF